MTDKCWFVLRHAYQAPPTIPSHGIGQSRGPLSIGHVITSTRSLDVINAESGPVAYPPSMPVVRCRVYNFEWKFTDEGNLNVSTNVDAPVAALAGIDMGLSAGVAFKTAVNRCFMFERLETFYVNITQSYVDDTMETAEVESYVYKHKEWLVRKPSLYIITGIMVGRKGKISGSDNAERGVNAETSVGVSGIAGLSAGVDVSGSKGSSSSQEADDFIFAIRVAKVTKGVLDKSWSWGTLSEGATFGTRESPEESVELFKAQLEQSGQEYSQVIGLEDHADQFFVL
ncbi:hypothetical protein NPX13_g8433 [Xylaria arbuscula]|uniref:Uncharacterized protein n=1 Tax=Xylaria arbuscula TaxID=114810 RepID=A0A9W8TJU7_9PEZI|nr:hypothetical protein NPX13_g8433 [Xylaria arbuscula]